MEADIIIRFATQVQYLRHVPLERGTSLRIYTRLNAAPGLEAGSARETLRLPDNDLVPGLTLTYPEADGGLSIAFESLTQFAARGGSDGRSIIVTVQVLPNARDWAVQAKRPALPAGSVAATHPVASASAARNRSIDAIEVRRLPGEKAEILVRFTSVLRLARAVPAGAGDTLNIPLQRSQTGISSGSQGRETNRVQGVDLVPGLTVTYPEADGSLLVRFDASTPYAVAPGTDDQSISIVVPMVPGAKDFSFYAQGSPPAPEVAAAPPIATAIAPPGTRISPATASAQPTGPAPSNATESTPPPSPVMRDGMAASQTAAAPSFAAPTAPVTPVPASPVPIGAEPSNVAPAGSISAGTTPLAAGTVLEPLTQDDIEGRAKWGVQEAQRALARRQGVTASERLGLVLALPPNSQSRLAQALIGEAREYTGELRKAKAEYELYLKLYPAGPEAAQVKERLAAVNQKITQAVAATPGGRGLGAPAQWMIYGGFSQYSYRGNTQMETITPPPPGQVTGNSNKLAMQDQNSIISTLDLNARKRDGDRDTRIVFRDTNTHNFLYGQRQQDRLYSAYFEQSDKGAGYLVRAGRQIGNGGGVFGRFDGLWAGYNLTPNWRLNGVVGTPVEFGTPLTRSLHGLSIDRLPQPGEVGYSVYYVEQPLEGVNDRKAVGAEARYFDPKRTAFGMVDYDINFQSLNMAMAQGNWRTDDGTSLFANADIRKSPPLGLLSAMPAQQTLDPVTLLPVFTDLRTQLRNAVNTYGIGELRSQASMLSSTSRLYSVGFMRPVSPKWQMGGDFRIATTTGTGDVGIMPAMSDQGYSRIYSGTALGSNLALTNDTLVLNTSLVDAPTYYGQSYIASYVVPYNSWRFDTIFRYYEQKDNQEQRQERMAPSFKLTYRWRTSVSFEMEMGNEFSREVGPLREMHTKRRYFFGGYRWDFR